MARPLDDLTTYKNGFSSENFPLLLQSARLGVLGEEERGLLAKWRKRLMNRAKEDAFGFPHWTGKPNHPCEWAAREIDRALLEDLRIRSLRAEFLRA